MKVRTKKEPQRETLSCCGEEERPRPWMPTRAWMSEFSDSSVTTEIRSTLEHPTNTKREFEGLGETKVEQREHDSNPILFTFTTLRVRAIVTDRQTERESECSLFFCYVMCVAGAKIMSVPLLPIIHHAISIWILFFLVVY